MLSTLSAKEKELILGTTSFGSPTNKLSSTDPEQAAEGKRDPARAPLVQFLRTSGCVVFVAAAGFVLYYLLAGHAGSSTLSIPVLSLLAQTSKRGLGTPPKGDDRKYQHTVLSNGLQVVNVLDKRAVQTAFAMAVEAGSFDDPEALPGLAHFCEHMLFLGTKLYPDASGFDNFMSANGGFNNAYTADEVTVYFAEMSQAAGKEGLDRFADFFRAPLFNKTYVSKEVHAIDSEHAKNVQDPQRRVLQVAFSLANPQSPVPAFHTGDAETLYNTPKKFGVDPVEELKVYFKSHYCPPKMRLVTYGSESLAEQLAEATKDFGSLSVDPSCKGERQSFASPAPWGPKRMGRFVKVQGTLPQAEMWLHFTLPDVSKQYRSQPLNYLEHVLSYGGKDSLGRVLQDNLGLITSHQAMFDMNSAGTNCFVMMHLTTSGQQNMQLILDVFYSYLAKLRSKGVDNKLYDSLADVEKLKWDWAEPAGPSDLASTLAERMIRLPAEHLLSGDNLIEKPNSSLVKSLIDALEPPNMNVIFVEASSKKAQNTSLAETKDVHDDMDILPHYGVKYKVQLLEEVVPGAAKRWRSWLNGAAVPDVASRLPTGSKSLVTSGPVQPKVPTAIKDVPTEIPLENMHAVELKGELYGHRPKRLVMSLEEDPQFLQSASPQGTSLLKHDSEIWYRSGWATTSPKVQLQLALRPVKASIAKDMSVSDSLRLGVFGRLISEAMVPQMVDLTATGVGYAIDATPKGLTFTFSGFSPMMPTLITKVLKEFNGFTGNANATQPARFKRVTQEIKDSLSTYSEMPISYALADRNMLLSVGQFSRAEQLKALSDITIESASSAVDDALLSQRLRLTSLAMGNIAEKEAHSAITAFVKGIHTPTVGADKVSKLPGQHEGSELTGEPERVSPVVRITRPIEIRSKNPRPGDPNDAVVLSIVAGVSNLKSRVVLGILGQILSAVAYNELRTARQLGYVVNAGTSQVSNVQYVSCVVQGNSLKADHVEAAIEHVYLHLMPKRLAELTDKEFANYKASFREDLVQPPSKFQDEVSHFWGPVAQGGQCFDLRSNMVRFLDDSLHSKEVLVKAWANLANPSEGMRNKMAVKYFADSIPPRPSEEEAAAIWSEQGVADQSAVSLLRREYQETKIYDHVDSKVRDQIFREGGYYPQDLNCELEKASLPAKTPSPKFLSQAAPHSF